MLEFPKDTRDTIEKEHWPEIEKYYPSYKKFWKEFVGVQIDDESMKPYKFMRPYGLKIKEVSVDYNNNKYKKYLEMCMRHYSIFCDITVVRKEIAEMEKALQLGPEQEHRRHQEHWRHFENIYFRFGSIYYRFKGMWNGVSHLFKLFNYPFPEIKKGKKGDHNKYYVVLQDNKLFPKEMQKYNLFQEEVVGTVRYNVIHFARHGANVSKDGKFLVSKNIGKDDRWYSSTNFPEDDSIDTLTLVNQDFENVFKWLEPLEGELIDLIDAALQSSNVSIDYEKGEPFNESQKDLCLNDPIQPKPFAASGMVHIPQKSKNSIDCNWS